MTDYAIRVSELGKRYPLHQQHNHHYGLRHIIESRLTAPFRFLQGKTDPMPRSTTEDFWALKDVSFDIKPGDAVGIIGRNGAGKSTLLKVLSRITEPTRGRVEIKGRVASLLEVGTGFHPELTGRENIYLNGTILGMTRKEINRKFDEIVAFAETEKFLDTPVKHHSSGMYVRLAFAVAAHLEPQILIVDEVLAVGDAQFQKKCLGKMEDVSKREGRTVLFVSHNMTAIAALTDRVILLKKGAVQYTGPAKEAFDLYMKEDAEQDDIYTAAPSSKRPNITRAEVECSQSGNTHASGEPWKVHFDINFPQPMSKASLSFQIFNQFQAPVLRLAPAGAELALRKGAGMTSVTCTVPKLDLNVGAYTLKVYLSGPPGGGPHYETLESICPFHVVLLDKKDAMGLKADWCSYLVDSQWAVE